jgi:hypothetical protein
MHGASFGVTLFLGKRRVSTGGLSYAIHARDQNQSADRQSSSLARIVDGTRSWMVVNGSMALSRIEEICGAI